MASKRKHRSKPSRKKTKQKKPVKNGRRRTKPKKLGKGPKKKVVPKSKSKSKNLGKGPKKKVAPKSKSPRLYDNKQILELVDRVKNNDEDAFREISKMLHGFLQHLSLKKFFFVAGNNHEDIYQEGLMALSSKAIPDYDRDKGPFLSFAKLCIKRHIITCLKSANNNKNRALNSSVSMDATVTGEDEDGPMSISSFLSSDDEVVVDRICRLEQNKALRYELEGRLTPLELRVLSFYLKSMSYVDIVECMNRRRRHKVNTKAIDNALCRIKNKAFEIELQEEKERRKKPGSKVVDNALSRIKKKALEIERQRRKKAEEEE